MDKDNVVYFRLRSAKDFQSVPIDGPFISAAELKVKIVQSNCYGRGKDSDLLMSDAVTGADIVDESMMIARGSSVLIRRVPGRQQKPTTLLSNKEHEKVHEIEDVPPRPRPPPSQLYEVDVRPHVLECRKDLQSHPPLDKDEEDEKIKLLVNTPSLQGYDCFNCVSPRPVSPKSYKNMHEGSRRCLVPAHRKPSPGYVCHRCNEPGHFIKYCPTNGDPAYDIIKQKPLTGIPKSMLQASSSGGTTVLKSNEDAFDKEMQGISSTKRVSYLGPELLCPLCQNLMAEAVMSSKCCLNSFCDKCIREHIISKSMCHCGDKDVLVDDLIPNRTLREFIINARFFELH